MNKSMENLTNEVGTILNQRGGTEEASVKIPEWHNNFPDTVAIYIVKSGDTLSSIAVAQK